MAHTTFMKSVHTEALNKIAWKLMEKWMKFNFIEILEATFGCSGVQKVAHFLHKTHD